MSDIKDVYKRQTHPYAAIVAENIKQAVYAFNEAHAVTDNAGSDADIIAILTGAVTALPGICLLYTSFRVTRDFRMNLIVCFVIVLCIVCQTVPEVRPT